MTATLKPASDGQHYRYRAFGLTLESELPLPELLEHDGSADVRITIGPVRHPPLQSTPDGRAFSAVSGDRVWLSWNGVGTFEVRSGTDITVNPDSEAPPERLRLFLLGAAIGTLLHQRGLLVLHASATSTAGHAVAFLGGKRSGKSTLAALLHARGSGLVADDVVAVNLSGPAPTVVPGPPQIKLWPDSVEVIGADPGDLPRLHPQFDKRDYRVEDGIAQTPLPLGAVYVLDSGDGVWIERMDSRDALAEAISHWYCARFEYETLRSLDLSAPFLQTVDLVTRTPFYRLTRPHSLSSLHEVASVLETSMRRARAFHGNTEAPSD